MSQYKGGADDVVESKYDAENLLLIKILKCFQTYGMSGSDRLGCFQKSIDSTEKLSLIVSFVITRPNM